MATEVLNNKTEPITREDIRRTFYKSKIRRDNIKLEFDDDTPQEERRRLLLEYQKKHREEAFNAARGILQETYFSEVEDKEEPMDTEQYRARTKSHRYRRHPMMLSEWMVDVPQDLTETWIMVPCPLGKRSRLVASKGVTKVYSRKGKLCNTFHSALPGGNPDADWRQYAVLDCIWMKKQKVYYVLDVLSWRAQPLTSCEAEFRLYWIDSKLGETEELGERDTERNAHPILPLPRISCNSDLSAALMDLPPELLPLDGLLFYHRNAQYNFGRTPLVTWLKPFMLPEVLGVSVPPPLDERPDDYVNFEHYINSTTKSGRSSKKVVENFMEIV